MTDTAINNSVGCVYPFSHLYKSKNSILCWSHILYISFPEAVYDTRRKDKNSGVTSAIYSKPAKIMKNRR